MNTIKHDSIEAQNISREFVRTEVYANVGALVDYILRKSYEDNDTPFSYEDFQLEVDPSNWGALKLKAYIEDELGATWEDATAYPWEIEIEEEDNNGEPTGTKWIETPADDEDEYEDDVNAAKDYIRDNAPSREVLEWWAVSDYLLSALESEGKIVAHVGGNLNIWGRQTTGKAIYMDYVIEKIALERYERIKEDA